MQPCVSELEKRSVHDKLQTSAQTHSGLAAVRHCPCGWGHPVTQMPVPPPHPSSVTALCTHRAPPPPTLHSAETTEVPQHLQQPVGVNSPSPPNLVLACCTRRAQQDPSACMHHNRCAVMRSITATGCPPAAGKLQTSRMPSKHTRSVQTPHHTVCCQSCACAQRLHQQAARRQARQHKLLAPPQDTALVQEWMQAGVRRRTPRQTGQQTDEHRDRQVASQ